MMTFIDFAQTLAIVGLMIISFAQHYVIGCLTDSIEKLRGRRDSALVSPYDWRGDYD